MLEKALLRAIIRRTGQPGQVDQHGDLGRAAFRSTRRQVQVERHFAAGGGGIVAELEELAAEGGDASLFSDPGHDGWDGRESVERGEMGDGGEYKTGKKINRKKEELTFLRGVRCPA